MGLRFHAHLEDGQVKAVLSATETIVSRQIEERGEDAQLLVDGQGNQAFRNVVDGYVVAIWNLRPQKIMWGHVRDVMMGLERYCSNQECAFEFSIGTGAAIGRGHLKKGYS